MKLNSYQRFYSGRMILVRTKTPFLSWALWFNFCKLYPNVDSNNSCNVKIKLITVTNFILIHLENVFLHERLRIFFIYAKLLEVRKQDTLLKNGLLLTIPCPPQQRNIVIPPYITKFCHTLASWMFWSGIPHKKFNREGIKNTYHKIWFGSIKVQGVNKCFKVLTVSSAIEVLVANLNYYFSCLWWSLK